MKKILFIIPTLSQTNGVAAFMMNYIKYFERKDFDVEVIYQELRTSESYIELLKKCNINAYKLPYVREVGSKSFNNEIKKFFKEHHNYDLIYSNIAYKTYMFYKEAKKYGIDKFAIHAHATQSSDNKLFNFIGDIIQKKVNRVVKYKFACSKLAGEAMFKNDNFVVVNNAIDYNKYRYNETNRVRIRRELKLSDNNRVIGFIGRYTQQKNVFFFIDLIKKLPEQYKVVMIGNGPQKEEFIKKVKENDLEGRFILINETPIANEYYSVFDYFLLPSLYEGLPFVGVEAQVNGLPCLFSDTITKECKISDNTIYLNKNNIDEWIYEIKKMKRNNEIKLSDNFNIAVQSKIFEKELKNII